MRPRLFTVLLLACALALVAGCGQSGSRAGSRAASAGSSEEEVVATITELTQAVRKYAVEQRQAPKTLEELVGAGYLDRIPAAPQGKKYVIDKTLQVSLANR